MKFIIDAFYKVKHSLLFLGTERVVNGNFDSDITSWTNVAGRGTSSWNAGRLRVTNDLASSFANAFQDVDVVTGKTYRVKADLFIGDSSAIELRIFSSVGGNLHSENHSIDTSVEFSFVADDDSVTIVLYNWQSGNTGDFVEFDNISVKEIKA